MRQNNAGKHIPNVSHLAGSQVNTDAPACQTGASLSKRCKTEIHSTRQTSTASELLVPQSVAIKRFEHRRQTRADASWCVSNDLRISSTEVISRNRVRHSRRMQDVGTRVVNRCS